MDPSLEDLYRVLMQGADRSSEWIDELDQLLERPAWHREAACAGMPTELFFPSLGKHATEAKAVCARCPVRGECLNDAMSDVWFVAGIWGGTNRPERMKLRASDAA